jgi:predicted flap endonuclease-1-like 5' DNA nuclease
MFSYCIISHTFVLTQLPGIGEAAEQKLKAAGIEHVSML